MRVAKTSEALPTSIAVAGLSVHCILFLTNNPVCASLKVFILQGANMQAAAYINPDQNDYSSYANVQQSMLLRFGIAAVWFLVLGVAQVRHAVNAHL
jgi:hypothetical protein